MKSIHEPIFVHWGAAEATLEWRERAYAIEEVLERWYYRGKWWLDPRLRGESRSYFRVICRLGQPHFTSRGPKGASSSARVFEIYRRFRPGLPSDWVLSRVVD